MLNRDVDKILFDENNKFIGIESQGEVIYYKNILMFNILIIFIGRSR